MKDILIVAAVIGIMVAAGSYVYKSKKRGQTCVGCPYSKECAKKRQGNGCGKEN
ncbi:MAG: hypothetical protein IKM60_00710 [Clostridia bacterium]|nr:hypothetical protein [Clostridia bacterium]